VGAFGLVVFIGVTHYMGDGWGPGISDTTTCKGSHARVYLMHPLSEAVLPLSQQLEGLGLWQSAMAPFGCLLISEEASHFSPGSLLKGPMYCSESF
jgi:hypothetical protein